MKKFALLTLGFLTLFFAVTFGVNAQRFDVEEQNRIYNFVRTRQQHQDQINFVRNARRENLYPSNRYVIRQGQYKYKGYTPYYYGKQDGASRSYVNTTNTRVWNNQNPSDYVVQYPKTEPVLKNIGQLRMIYENNGQYYFINRY